MKSFCIIAPQSSRPKPAQRAHLAREMAPDGNWGSDGCSSLPKKGVRLSRTCSLKLVVTRIFRGRMGAHRSLSLPVPWIYTENMSTHTQTWEADYRIQCHQVAGFQQHEYSKAGDFCIFPSRAVHQSCVISKVRGQRDYKLSMFFAIAEPNRPVTEWITAFGCATKKK